MENMNEFWKAVAQKFTTAQADIAIEEMAELIQALSHRRRRPDDPQSLENLYEELADVEIMLYQLRYIYNLDEDKIDAYKKAKYERTYERLHKYLEDE